MKVNDWILIKEALQEKLMKSNSLAMDCHLAIVLSEVEGIITEETLPRPDCKICKRQFSNMDMKVRKSLPVGICSTCFTSNA